MIPSNRDTKRRTLRRHALLLLFCVLMSAVTVFVIAAFFCIPTNPFYRKSGKGFSHDVNDDGVADIDGVRHLGLQELWMETPLSTRLQEQILGKDIEEAWSSVRPLVFNGQAKSLSLDEFVSLGLHSSAARYGSNQQAPPRLNLERREAGWPLRAFRYQSIYTDGQTIQSNHVVFHFRNMNNKLVPAKVPIVPIWRGLVVNVLVFTAFWYFVFMLIPTAMWIARRIRERKRSRRIAAGLCPTCRYAGGHIGTCPECGNVTL